MVREMRNKERIDEILGLLSNYWKQYPDLRFGQIAVIISNQNDPFYVEDDVIIKRLQEEIEIIRDNSIFDFVGTVHYNKINPMNMTILYFQKTIFRQHLRNHPNMQFLFGDNMVRKGFGGQAKEMRGEPNAVGIPTKWSPGMKEQDFFTDDDFDKVKDEIDASFNKIKSNVVLIIPAKGVGTGLAELPQRAPKIYSYILEKIKELETNALIIKR
jgi:uncharacterized protein YihD (DUF1040 family)